MERVIKKNKKGSFFPAAINYEIISFLMRGKRRNKVLYSLKSPKMPKEIADNCKLSASNVSASLKELFEKDLIKCITQMKKSLNFIK